MSALPKKHGGWADEFKKSSSKRNVLENIEKERFLSAGESRDNSLEIPEIDEIQSLDDISSEPPTKAAFNKELDVDILKKNSISVDDKSDLTILIETLEPENEIEEPDEVWSWNNLFTTVSALISDEK